MEISKINGVDLYNAVSAVDFDLGIEIGKSDVVDIALGRHEEYPAGSPVANIVMQVIGGR